MTNLELFCALNHISAENLSDAEALQGDVPFSRPKTRKRFFLIAALIALTLLLVGCAVAYSSGSSPCEVTHPCPTSKFSTLKAMSSRWDSPREALDGTSN